MGDNHVGCIRGFSNYRDAWYAQPTHHDSVMFGWYMPNDGTTGEMEMKWEDIGGVQVPRLCCYDDGWHALSTFRDVIAVLGNHDDENITPAQFCQILLDCGFTDMTQRKV